MHRNATLCMCRHLKRISRLSPRYAWLQWYPWCWRDRTVIALSLIIFESTRRCTVSCLHTVRTSCTIETSQRAQANVPRALAVLGHHRYRSVTVVSSAGVMRITVARVQRTRQVHTRNISHVRFSVVDSSQLERRQGRRPLYRL